VSEIDLAQSDQMSEMKPQNKRARAGFAARGYAWLAMMGALGVFLYPVANALPSAGVSVCLMRDGIPNVHDPYTPAARSAHIMCVGRM